MSWLWDNALANMYGPHFLLVYGSVIVLILVVCWWQRRRSDQTRTLPAFLIPSQLDPHDVAYLRGGKSAVTRLELLAMVQRGYLRITPRHGTTLSTVQQAHKPPDLEQLTSSEQRLFAACASAPLLEEIISRFTPTYDATDRKSVV